MKDYNLDELSDENFPAHRVEITDEMCWSFIETISVGAISVAGMSFLDRVRCGLLSAFSKSSPDEGVTEDGGRIMSLIDEVEKLKAEYSRVYFALSVAKDMLAYNGNPSAKTTLDEMEKALMLSPPYIDYSAQDRIKKALEIIRTYTPVPRREGMEHCTHASAKVFSYIALVSRIEAALKDGKPSELKDKTAEEHVYLGHGVYETRSPNNQQARDEGADEAAADVQRLNAPRT